MVKTLYLIKCKDGFVSVPYKPMHVQVKFNSSYLNATRFPTYMHLLFAARRYKIKDYSSVSEIVNYQD